MVSERTVFHYQMETGAAVRIVASDDYEIDELALETLEEVVAMKRRELQKRRLPKYESWP